MHVFFFVVFFFSQHLQASHNNNNNNNHHHHNHHLTTIRQLVLLSFSVLRFFGYTIGQLVRFWYINRKTCIKRPLSKRPKIGFLDQLSLNAGQKYCRMLQRERSAILSTFIKLPFVLSISSGPLTQVFLYLISARVKPLARLHMIIWTLAIVGRL